MRANRTAALIFCAGCAGLFAGPALPERADRGKPINLESDRMRVDDAQKTSVFEGKVVMTQGTLSIRADKVTLRQDKDGYQYGSASGNLASFRQKRDGADEYFEGYAQRAEYDGTKELLELFDRALLRRGQDDIRSNYISYNAATELFKAEGRAETKAVPGDPGPGARVRGTFQPKGDSPLPGTGMGKDAGKAAPAPPAAPLKPAAEIAAPAAK